MLPEHHSGHLTIFTVKIAFMTFLSFVPLATKWNTEANPGLILSLNEHIAPIAVLKKKQLMKQSLERRTKQMYSPKIYEQNVIRLFHLKQRLKKPMTHIVNEIISEYLNKLENPSQTNHGESDDRRTIIH